MIPTSTGTPCSFSQATRTAESPITDAMERSISPLTMTNVIASTTIAFSMLSSRRLIWFCGFRYPGTAMPVTTTITARMASSKPSQRTRRRKMSRAMGGLLRGGRRRPLLIPPPGLDPNSPQAPEDHLVRRHRQEDEKPEDRVLRERAHRRPTDQALLEHVDERCAREGADDRAAPPEDIHTADDDGRHHLELETLTGDDGDVPEAHEEEEAGQAGQGAAQQKRDEDVALDREAGDARRVGVGADREEPATVRQIRKDKLEDDHDGQREQDERPHVELAERDDRHSRQVQQPGGERVGRHRLGTRELDERHPIDGERAECRDDRRDAPECDDHAVDGAERAAHRDGNAESGGRWHSGRAGEERTDEVGDEPYDGADRKVDVAGEDDEGLTDGGDRDDREAGADVGEGLPCEVVRDLGREEGDDRDEDEHKRELADLLRSNAAEQEGHTTTAGVASCTMAVASTRSCVASALSKTAICRPSRITRMRSLMARTSGSSELMRMTAIPSWASSSMIWWTSAFAPTSRPRVGSSRMKTRGRVFSHLLRTTFCWLPPESDPAAVRTEGARMLRRSLKPCATASSAARLTRPNRLRYGRSVGSVTFAAIESGKTRPSCRRSSVV